ncbi:MAG: S-layer homology domain-containing protein [Dethiosulfatibacter sp.]|nr:S-layer homology domain-containing protein [Dethiosulfatibacter sp.]
MKKILSLVLVIALVLGSFSFAFADGHVPADVVGEDYQEAVEVLMALGVVNGFPDGEYKPLQLVTRAQMAKLLVEALGYGQLAGGTAPYSDTAGHWAAGSIGLASGIGLVQGYPDGTFKPEATVSFDEAVTMILRALGYTDESLRGAWPTNYKIKAIDLGLYDETSAQTGGADRGNVAQMLFNALGLKLVEIIDGVATPVTTGALLLIDKVGTKVDMSKLTGADQYFTYENIYDADEALDTVIDLTPYLYHSVTYYMNQDDEIAYVSTVHTDEYVGEVLEYASGKLVIEDADEDTKSFSVTSSTALFLNGDEAVGTTALTLEEDGSAYARVIYDDDGVYGVVAEQFNLVQISTEYSVRRPLMLNGASGIKLPVMVNADDDDVLDDANLTIVGDATTLADIEEDDLVYVYASESVNADATVTGHPEVLKLLVVRDVVSGAYTSRAADFHSGVFGGVSYSVSSFNKVVTDFLNSDHELVAVPDGKTYDLTLDKDGKVYSMALADDTPDTEGYALFVDFADGVLTSEFSDVTVDKAARVRLFNSSGNVVVYNLDISNLDLEDTDDSDDLGDLTIDVDTNALTISTSLTKGALVEYEVNSDGEVTLVSAVTTTTGDYDKDEMLVGNYDVTDTTIVFNTVGTLTDQGDWLVEDVDGLSDITDAEFLVPSSGFEVAVMVIDEPVSDTIYAAVTSVIDYYDGSDTVKQVKAFVDGVERTYLTKVANNDQAVGIVDNLVTLTLTDGRITATSIQALNAGNTEQVVSIEGSRLRVVGDILTLADDVVVYLINDGDFEVGELGDLIEDDYIHVFPADDVEVIILNLTQTGYPMQ